MKGRSEIDTLAIDSSFFLRREHPIHLVRSSAPQGKGKILPSPEKNVLVYVLKNANTFTLVSTPRLGSRMSQQQVTRSISVQYNLGASSKDNPGQKLHFDPFF